MIVAALLVALVVAWLVFQAARLAVFGLVLRAALMAGVALGSLAILRALLPSPRRVSRRLDADGTRQLPRAT